MNTELLELIFAKFLSGWQGIATLYVTWAFLRQIREWQTQRARAGNGNDNGAGTGNVLDIAPRKKHNPSPEVHEAIDMAVAPIHDDILSVREDLAAINRDILGVAQRVSKIEGKLGL